MRRGRGRRRRRKKRGVAGSATGCGWQRTDRIHSHSNNTRTILIVVRLADDGVVIVVVAGFVVGHSNLALEFVASSELKLQLQQRGVVGSNSNSNNACRRNRNQDQNRLCTSQIQIGNVIGHAARNKCGRCNALHLPCDRRGLFDRDA